MPKRIERSIKNRGLDKVKASNFLKIQIIKECALNQDKDEVFFNLTDKDFENKDDFFLYKKRMSSRKIVEQKISLDTIEQIIESTLRQSHLILNGWHDKSLKQEVKAE